MRRLLRYPGLLIAIAIVVVAIVYYWPLLTAGHPTQLFAMDPYSKLYPNMWEHFLHGNFRIDKQDTFGEYFITKSGQTVVYFGFMPAILRGIASIFNPHIYTYNLGNLSILLAVTLALIAVIYVLEKMGFLRGRMRLWSLLFIATILFATPLVYLAIWGRVHNEVIAWSTSWGIIFVAFYTLWIFGKQKERRRWHVTVLGLSVGMAILCRPTLALTVAVPYAYLVGMAMWQWYRKHDMREARLLLPSVICAVLLTAFALVVNYGRWGSPLTFVQMDRHVDLLVVDPKRGADLQKAGEFNMDRLPSALAYYFVPTRDNFRMAWPYVELDQQLTIMDHAPQYDYIEGDRVPFILSIPVLLVAIGVTLYALRALKQKEKWATVAMLCGGSITLFALCTVYTVALRYSDDMLPLAVFGGFASLVFISRRPYGVRYRYLIAISGLLVISIYITTITALQYKIISGQLGLSEHFRTRLSRLIHFPPEPGAKLFILDGVPSPAVGYER